MVLDFKRQEILSVLYNTKSQDVRLQIDAEVAHTHTHTHLTHTRIF